MSWPRSILVPALIAGVLHLLDGATAVVMMQELGSHTELNPTVRAVFERGGPVAVMTLKASAASFAIWLFVGLARRGRLVLAHSSLALACGLGLLGVISNIA